MPALRVLTYNIRSQRGDPVSLARVIRGCAPDVLCLQEAPRMLRWRARRAALARATRLSAAVGRRAAGLALLAAPAHRLLGAEYHLLSRVPGMHRRGLALGVFEVAGARVTVGGFHLDLDQAARLRHAREIIALAGRLSRAHGAPLVLAGDLNEPPGGPVWEAFGEHLADAYPAAPRGGELTFSSSRPRVRIDAVFAGPGVAVESAGVPEGLGGHLVAASDHHPVLAELRLR